MGGLAVERWAHLVDESKLLLHRMEQGDACDEDDDDENDVSDDGDDDDDIEKKRVCEASPVSITCSNPCRQPYLHPWSVGRDLMPRKTQ